MRSQTEEQLLYCKKDGTKRKTVLIKQLSPDDSAEYINAQIATAEDGSRIIFETGRYHLNSQINISNKNAIIIDGNNSVFDPLYDKKGYSRNSVNAFNFENCSNLQIGMNYCLRHFYYEPCTFIFSQCSNVTAEDVKIHNIGGMGFLILPQCSDFVFRRITFSPLDISKQFFLSNADEIHIIGLTGKLLIENCCFENLGDDVINAHTQVINCRNIG